MFYVSGTASIACCISLSKAAVNPALPKGYSMFVGVSCAYDPQSISRRAHGFRPMCCPSDGEAADARRVRHPTSAYSGAGSSRAVRGKTGGVSGDMLLGPCVG